MNIDQLKTQRQLFDKRLLLTYNNYKMVQPNEITIDSIKPQCIRACLSRYDK